ncbi:hypothetical protein F4808DRAFT_459362 [Astrocystis sublimbata]|nr:hypothetical protein F4808DRAFT_459362 [Astrocystis sublimbata]
MADFNSFSDSNPSQGVPPVKLIDFGRGQEINPHTVEARSHRLRNRWDIGTKVNLLNAAHAMGLIACPMITEDDFDEEFGGPANYQYRVGNEQHTVVTKAFLYLRESGEMDLDLRTALVRCHAVDFKQVPSLQELLDQAEDKVANRGPDDNIPLAEHMNVQEDDEYIRRFLDEFIYNPPVA